MQFLGTAGPECEGTNRFGDFCYHMLFLPCSSSSSKSTCSSIGLVLRPVTLCRRWARCTAKSRPDLRDSALVSNSARDSASNSAPELGNFSGSGSGFRLNSLADHFSHDFTCHAFHSAGSVGSSTTICLWMAQVVWRQVIVKVWHTALQCLR